MIQSLLPLIVRILFIGILPILGGAALASALAALLQKVLGISDPVISYAVRLVAVVGACVAMFPTVVVLMKSLAESSLR